ncbi:hypothetical protein [Microbacterium sp. SLBN-146]|uniref:hypothetical protein n=1 Tax=Microbacterium sp. SLBN-146 TaxID=2768457 RepID=UPI00114DEF33|nr:hypothetical protein [Microbacterium sp. SLBN-146]TQJ31472.1 hypothetical protein FBY39_1948 [Microbacterium sp. SLBN-146]
MEWGSLADWFAAIGTVGALFATLSLFVHSQRSEARRVGQELSLTAEGLYDEDAFSLEKRIIFKMRFRVYNSGSAPIHDARILAYEDGKTLSAHALSVGGEPIEPQRSFVFIWPVESTLVMDRMYIHHTDRTGREWVRNVHSGEVLKRSEAKEVLKAVPSLTSYSFEREGGGADL